MYIFDTTLLSTALDVAVAVLYAPGSQVWKG